MAISPKALTVFATLEALRDDHADIRYPLATLFQPDLSKFNGDIFNASHVAKEINKQYHLGVTSDIIEGFVDIFLSRGWLQKLEGQRNVAFRVTCPPVKEVSDEEKKFSETAEKIAKKFREFILDISPLNQVSKTDTEIIDMLVDWLLLLDRSGEMNVKGAATTYRLGKKIVLDVDDQTEGGAPSEDAFLSARFVEFLFETESEFIPFLIELSEVGLVSEVVRDFQRPTNHAEKTDLKLYLDAPLAMDYLGLSGKPQQQSIEFVLNGLKRMGGEIRIFRESIEELQAALYGILSRPHPERTGPTADALRRREVLEPYVRQVQAHPDKFLAAKGIGIVDETIDMYPHQHKFFSRDVYEQLYSAISWVKDDAAKHHDAAIATIAFRKRGGTRSNDIFKTKHLVVTRNPTFPRLTRRLARESNYIGPSHVGPVVHQRQLATAIWLRVGLGRDNQIPRSYILSACRRVLSLRRNIVERVHNFKKNLSDEQTEQLEVLLTSDRSTQVLMDRTLGSANIVSANNIELLLEDMREAQVAELRAEQKVELQKIASDSKQQTDLLRKDIEELHAAKDASVAEQERAARQLDEVFERALTRINARISRLRFIYGLGLAFILAVAIAASMFLKVQGTSSRIALFLILFLLFGLVQFSPAVRKYFLDKRFEGKDQQYFEEGMRDFGLTPDEFEEKVFYDGSGFKRI